MAVDLEADGAARLAEVKAVGAPGRSGRERHLDRDKAFEPLDDHDQVLSVLVARPSHAHTGSHSSGRGAPLIGQDGGVRFIGPTLKHSPGRAYHDPASALDVEQRPDERIGVEPPRAVPLQLALLVQQRHRPAVTHRSQRLERRVRRSWGGESGSNDLWDRHLLP